MSFPVYRALALTAVLALTAAACGGSSAAEPTDPPAANPTQAPTPSGEPAPTNAPAPADAPAPTAAPGPVDPNRIAGPGDAISVHYVGTLDDGEQFDSSRDRGQPLSFVVASGQMIAGFDAAVQGMKLGEAKTVRIEAADAYGEWTEDQIISVALDQLPEGTAVGQELYSQQGQRFLVLEVNATEARLDANHALAGEALTFEIELVSFDN
jgi:FKBP-type peptidyl-prolyl cis-trans isomerase 2